MKKTFIAMVCVEAREICTISANQLAVMIAARHKEKGGREDQCTVLILVTAPKAKGLRVYMNQPGINATVLGKELIVNKNSFPSVLFK